MRTLLLLLALAVSAEARVCGDCDGDGWVGTVDALIAAQIAAGLDTTRYPGLDLRACDVRAPEGVTVLDALRIAQAAVGVPVVLSCV